MDLIKFDGHKVDVLNADGTTWDGIQEAWFIPKQIAEAIGASSPDVYATKILNRNPRKFKSFRSTTKMVGEAGVREVNIFNENGLYMFLMASDLDKAVDFQLRVTDMLKNIRQGKLQLHKTVLPDELQLKRQNAESRLRNSKTRQSKLLLDIAEKFKNKLSQEAIESLVGNATAIMLDRPLLAPTKVSSGYTAGDIAKETGKSANAVGRLATKYNLKTDEYGITVLDKSKYSDKQVTSFLYNEAGKQRIIELLQAT